MVWEIEFLKTGEEGELFKEGVVYSVESSAENCWKESKVGAWAFATFSREILA